MVTADPECPKEPMALPAETRRWPAHALAAETTMVSASVSAMVQGIRAEAGHGAFSGVGKRIMERLSVIGR